MKYVIGLWIFKVFKNNIGKSLVIDVEGEIFENIVFLEFFDFLYNNIFYFLVFMFKNM